MKPGLYQEMDSFTNVMQTQIKRTIMLAINDEVIPEIQRVVENLPIREDNFGAGLSAFRQVFGDQLAGSQTNLIKKNLRSAFDNREDTDQCPYSNLIHVLKDSIEMR